MSSSEDMKALREKRSRELAEKKKRLEDLRKKKEEARAARAGGAAAAPAAAAKPADDGAFDQYINSVLESTAPAGAAKAESEAAAAAPAAESATTAPAAAPRAPVTLSVSTMCVINIPSRTAECYEKGTQTMDAADDDEEEGGVVLQASPEKRAAATDASDSTAAEAGKTEKEEEARPAELSTEEKKAKMEEPVFMDFVTKSSLIMERALGQASAYDILVDYSGTEDGDSPTDATNAVKQQLLFSDKQLCQQRTVTDMGFSPFYKELLLVSYNARHDSSSDWNWQSSAGADQSPDGLVLVWSLLMNSRPEFVFTCQSAVLTALFDPFDPKLIVGGTYSGQVVLWDTRAKSSPVQQTPLSAKGHTHPIYSMGIVGTQNAHSLVSASTDGKMCVWGTGQLTQPTDTLMLKQTIAPTDSITSSISSGKEREVDVAVTAISFPEGESNDLCIGAEDGSVFRAQIHGR
jgi:dynein intermediate chain